MSIVAAAASVVVLVTAGAMGLAAWAYWAIDDAGREVHGG